jgi:membrane protease YdiL (CAAX protease family)
MLAAVAAACAGLGLSATAVRLGVRFHPLDFFWCVGAGCFARAIDAIVRLQLSGTTGLEPQPTLAGSGIDGWLIATVFFASVVLAPLIEEVFFRGLLQRSLARSMRRVRPRAASVIAVAATSVVFSLVHVLVGADTGAAAISTAIGTFVFSLAAGSLMAATSRIGGAVVAHVVFNGVAVLLVWPR